MRSSQQSLLPSWHYAISALRILLAGAVGSLTIVGCQSASEETLSMRTIPQPIFEDLNVELYEPPADFASEIGGQEAGELALESIPDPRPTLAEVVIARVKGGGRPLPEDDIAWVVSLNPNGFKHQGTDIVANFLIVFIDPETGRILEVVVQ